MKKYRIMAFISLIFLLGAIGFILFNGTQVSAASNARSNALAAWLKRVLLPNVSIGTLRYVVRKAAHMAEYALLGFLASLTGFFARLGEIRVSVFATVTLILSTAITDEFLQSLIDRTSSVKDILFDAAGGLCGIAVAGICYLILLLFKLLAERRRLLENR